MTTQINPHCRIGKVRPKPQVIINLKDWQERRAVERTIAVGRERVGLSPIVETWISQNPWFSRDAMLNEFAILVEKNILRERPLLSEVDRLEEVAREVKARFPEKFEPRQG